MKKVIHLTKISDFTKKEILEILEQSRDIKQNPEKYKTAMKDQTLLMLFEKPSLRTRVSFETGLTQMGGHAIYYDISTSPLGKKENFHDTAKCLSRYCDIIMARVMTRKEICELSKYSDIPVINGLDDFAHPCQIMADLLTIQEKKGTDLSKIKMAYVGDIRNNVTYDIMRAAAILGFELNVSGPKGKEYEVEECIWKEVKELSIVSGAKVNYVEDPKKAVEGVDVVYTDSWMSYQIEASKKEERMKILTPYQVNEELVKHAKKDYIFMNCLPAMRGMEQSEGVIDGPNSIVFDEAENRLHAQKGIMLYMLKNSPKKNVTEGKKMMIALGGNALISAKEAISAENLAKNSLKTAEQLVQLIKKGNKLTIAHGNGPQVGAIFLQNQLGVSAVPEMPLVVCGAESQGEIGYFLQQAFQNELRKEGINKSVCTIITQVEVDSKDPAFKNPTKPIGKFYTKEEAENLKKEGKTVIEDSGRGYRVVVPSPQPLRVVESEPIIDLVNMGVVTICGGGGGIPVMRNEKGDLIGIDAVIDKDRNSAILAEAIDADIFIIVTDIDFVYVDYKKPTQKKLTTVTVSEAKQYMKEGHFPEGSMLPKMESAVKFVEKTGHEALIAGLYTISEAIEGKSGTRIVPDKK
jgi:carbamate kinase